MHKNKKIILLVVFSVMVWGIFFAPEAHAQVNYTLLEKIPGFDSTDGSNLPGYITAIYRVALIVVTLSAVLMLSIGGFMYLTSAGNTSSLGTAKNIIYDSIIGLVIALCAWLVLNVINPDLTNISIGRLPAVPVTPIPQTGTPPTQGIGSPPTGSAVTYATQILSTSNINLNSSGDCSSPTGVVSPLRNIQETAAGTQTAVCYSGPSCASQGPNGCADADIRLSETMLRAIATVGATYRFTVTSLAGGPHSLRSSHYLGRGADIVPANPSEWQAILDAFVANGASAPAGNSGSMCENNKGKNVGCAVGSGADHIHLTFSN